MHLHEPTNRNQQGIDVKTQYRSVIFYEKGNHEELEIIKKTMEDVVKEGQYPGYPHKIAT